MGETLRNLFEMFAYFLFTPIYVMSVLMLAAYLNLYNVAGNITIAIATVPVVGAWIIVLSKRETRNVEALTQGFQTSPEIQTRALNEYLNLIDRKRDEQTDN